MCIRFISSQGVPAQMARAHVGPHVTANTSRLYSRRESMEEMFQKVDWS